MIIASRKIYTGMFSRSLVMCNINFNDGIVSIIYMLEDGRIVVSDPLNQIAIGREFHSSAFKKKDRRYKSPARIVVVLVSK